MRHTAVIRCLSLSACILTAGACEPHPPAPTNRADSRTAEPSRVAQSPAVALVEDSVEAAADSVLPVDTLPALDSIPLDSCARLDTAARPMRAVLQPGEVIPPPAAGNWTETMEVGDSIGRLTVPKSSVISYRPNPHYSLVAGGMPGCRYSCGVSIQYLRVVPRVAHAPPAEPDDDDWQPPPPKPILMGSQRGILGEEECGDCYDQYIVLTRGRRRVLLDFSLDDREGYQPGIMCRLARVASTFRWVDSTESR